MIRAAASPRFLRSSRRGSLKVFTQPKSTPFLAELISVLQKKCPLTTFDGPSSVDPFVVRDKLEPVRVPVPQLALAYMYSDYGDYDNLSQDSYEFSYATNNSSGSKLPPSQPSSHPYQLPTTDEENDGKQTRGKSGGGGGGGRNRCPKCGKDVTYDMEDNTAYCASCSGHFTIRPKDNFSETIVSKLGNPAKIQSQTEEHHSILRHGPDNSMTRRHQPTFQDDEESTIHQHQKESLQHVIMSPKHIAAQLDEYVIGQQKVKMALSVGVYNHYKRLYASDNHQSSKDWNKDNFVLSDLGPSTLHRHLDLEHPALPHHQFRQAPRGVDRTHTNTRFAKLDIDECEIDKSNIMILGPTGTLY
jgi:DNA-directed RNA polymerase subunit RPC12/RpoP